MIKIRLAIRGSKKNRFYHINIANSKSPRDGKFIEKIGFFNPKDNKNISINLNRLNYWISVGANISKKVEYILNKFNNDRKK